MDLTVEQVTVDCADPQRLAAFWAAALEGTVSADWGEFVVVSSAVPGLAHLGFQRADDPTPGKNRLHVDFQTADRTSEVARLQQLGATQDGEAAAPGMAWTRLLDPEGNVFCVCQPDGS